MMLNLDCQQARVNGLNIGKSKTKTPKQCLDGEGLRIESDPTQRPIGPAGCAAAKHRHSCAGCQQGAHDFSIAEQ
jgi:hypothetical protein